MMCTCTIIGFIHQIDGIDLHTNSNSSPNNVGHMSQTITFLLSIETKFNCYAQYNITSIKSK